ncbi:PIG-L deacetylase family protein [Bacteroidota bacterium]
MKKKSVLAICAHPDDLEFGCTITVKRLIEQGYIAYYVIATNGENGFKKPIASRQHRIAIRKKEQLAAANRIGVKKVIFLGYKDGFIEYKEDLRKRFTILIKQIKPEIVFSFDPANQEFSSLNLFHRDHRVVGLAAFDACFAAKNNYIYPHKNGAYKVDKIYFYGSNNPNHFINITKEIKFKLEVLSCHESQFSNFDEFAERFKERIAQQSKKYKYSEAFRVIEVVSLT